MLNRFSRDQLTLCYQIFCSAKYVHACSFIGFLICMFSWTCGKIEVHVSGACELILYRHKDNYLFSKISNYIIYVNICVNLYILVVALLLTVCWCSQSMWYKSINVIQIEVKVKRKKSRWLFFSAIFGIICFTEFTFILNVFVSYVPKYTKKYLFR